MKNLTLAEVQTRLPRIADEIEHDSSRVVGVRRRGKRILTLVSADRYDALLVTLELLTDTRAAERVRQGLREVSEGMAIPWHTAERRLRLDE